MSNTSYQKQYQNLETRMEKDQLIQRAAKSALYKDKWKAFKVDPNKLQGFRGLKKLPFVSADDLRKVWNDYSIEDLILTENVAVWHCTSGSMGNKKWMPWTYNDYTITKKEVGNRLMKKLVPTDILMAILLPAPFISSGIPHRIMEATGSLGTPIEQLVMAPEYVQDTFSLLIKRQPTVFMCTPSLALRMAEVIAENTPRILERRAKELKSAKLKLASLATKVIKIKPKRVFERLRLGYFVSESLAPFRKAVEEQYNLEAFDIYGFTEGFGAGIECEEHNGLHFPSLNCILEIIPEKELAKEAEDPNYIPKTVLMPEAEKGLTGELVITDFKEALPLLRYRVRDLVKVVGEDCNCDYDSNRIKILGRTDNIINLGVIRFSTHVINELLSKDFKNGEIAIWEVYITRDGFKPKIIMSVQPLSVKDEEAFKKEIFEALYAFEVFKTGYDNGLFAFGTIKFVDSLKLEIVGQGKSKRVRYDPNFSKPVKM